MKKQLVTRISSDLKIERYKGESEAEFYSRLIYTVISCWIRYFILDKSNNDSDINKKSKNYIMARGKDLLKNYLDLFPECADYFLCKEKNNKKIAVEVDEAIKTIRERMLNSGEIYEINPNAYVGVPQYNKKKIYRNIEREIGIKKDEFTSIHVGITRIEKNKLYEESEKIESTKLINPDEFLNWLIKNSTWERFNDIDILDVFDPKSKKIPSQSWNLNKSMILEGDIYLARDKSMNHKWATRYFLLKIEDGNKYYISRINNILVKWKECRRIILALRKKYENSIKVQVKNLGSCKKLRLFAALPINEMMILKTYCWPSNNMYNPREYIVSNEIWEYIRDILISLYLEIEEVL